MSFQSEAHDRQQDSLDRMSPLAVAGILTPPKSTEKPANAWRVWEEPAIASLYLIPSQHNTSRDLQLCVVVLLFL